MKTYRYAVTFENPETAPPRTFRGVVRGSSRPAAARLAVVDAQRQCGRIVCSSFLALLEDAEASAYTGPSVPARPPGKAFMADTSAPPHPSYSPTEISVPSAAERTSEE